MSEEQTETPPTPPTPEVIQKPLSSIDEANVILDKIEKARDENKEWVERAEALRSEQILSGTADAGSQQVVEKTDEQKLTDACNADLEGTGFSI